METLSAEKQMSRKMLKLIFRFESMKSVYWSIFTIKSIRSNSRLFGLVNLLDLGDKTDDVRKKTKNTKNKLLFYFSNRTAPSSLKLWVSFSPHSSQMCITMCIFDRINVWRYANFRPPWLLFVSYVLYKHC